jgi:molybdopterin-guanine dinucleotide biosynthesis protein B
MRASPFVGEIPPFPQNMLGSRHRRALSEGACVTAPVIGIAGWKNSGKTTLATRLIAELTRRGLRVASIKHAHHEADVDHAGTDTFRHRAAGAVEVALVTSRRWALIHELGDDQEPTLAETLSRLSPADIVVVEGYKREAIPKIEARRSDAAQTDPMAPGDPNIIAIASDHPLDEGGRPTFDLDDVGGIADFLLHRFGLAQR